MFKGNLIFIGKGNITINRVIDGGDGINPLKLEITFKGMGKCNNVDVGEIWTYIATVNQDGSTFGDGQGILYTLDPSTKKDIVVGTARGMGVYDDETGQVKNAGVVFYKCKNPTPRGALFFLHNQVGLNEFETNETTLEYTNKVWEWKKRTS